VTEILSPGTSAAPTPSGLITDPTTDVLTTDGQGLSAKPLSPSRIAWRRFRRHKLAMASAIFLIILTILIFFPRLLTPFGPLQQVDGVGAYDGPNRTNLLGTDQLRHDMLSRILHGGQISLQVGFYVAITSAVVGSAFGAIAGFYGRWIDNLMMRITDLFLAIPLIVALIICTRLPAKNAWAQTFFGDSGTVRSIVITLSLFLWMPLARIVRGVVLSLKEKEFIEAGKAMGASDLRIITRHLLPNCIGPIVVSVTLTVAAAILLESALSFLGYGVQSATTPTWGNLLSGTKGQLRAHGHVVWFPGLAIVITVLCVNYLGDGLRDALDPRQAKK
jgi:peptide/nickel transport system permease protein